MVDSRGRAAQSLARVLTTQQEEGWRRDGFFIVERFAPASTLEAMTERVTALARAQARGEDISPALVLPEPALASLDAPPERKLSKLFRVHRQEPVFHEFCRSEAVLDIVGAILGDDLDCFLSQFIWKRPRALGQPWHQDGWYFPFDRGPQVGLWLAITESRIDNGPLWVLPGSHLETVHDVVPDQRKDAPFSYVEIVDHDMTKAVPVLMQPGDLLVFHSHLMHRSTDNQSDGERAAMVFHYGEAGTIDRSEEKFGYVPPNVDWMPVKRRAG